MSGGVRPDKEERDAGICAHARQQRNAGYRTEGVVSEGACAEVYEPRTRCMKPTRMPHEHVHCTENTEVKAD